MKWVSVHEASAISGFSELWIRQLLRENKIKGRKVVTVWQVDEVSLMRYLSLSEAAEDGRYGPKSPKSAI